MFWVCVLETRALKHKHKKEEMNDSSPRVVVSAYAQNGLLPTRAQPQFHHHNVDQHQQQQPWSVRVAQRITDVAGSMPCVWVHAAWFAVWVLANSGALRPLVEPWDPFPYGLLTTVVSLEAIFLSLFCLIAQNAAEARARQRQQHDQQRLLAQLDALAERLDAVLARLPSPTPSQQQPPDNTRRAFM